MAQREKGEGDKLWAVRPIGNRPKIDSMWERGHGPEIIKKKKKGKEDKMCRYQIGNGQFLDSLR